MVEMIPENIWVEQDLLKCTIRQSGSKNGNIREITLAVYDESSALLTSLYIAGHGQSPVVKELLVDRNVLEEIKDVFLKEGIYGWDRRDFSRGFIADKASTAYNFLFSENDLCFSSQFFPKQYSDVLDIIVTIIERHQGLAENIMTDGSDTTKGDTK